MIRINTVTQIYNIEIPRNMQVSFDLFSFSNSAAVALKCHVGARNSWPIETPAEYLPPKPEECNKVYDTSIQMIDQRIKTIESYNITNADKLIEMAEKRKETLCKDDCVRCEKIIQTVYKDREKTEAAKTMMSKSCVGQVEMTLYPNFPDNKCITLTIDDIVKAQANMMQYNGTQEKRSKRSILTDQLNAIVFGRQYIEITHCSCSGDGCNDGSIHKPTFYFFIFLAYFSI